MIHIADKHNCCGCSACASVCPRGCISMRADSEGFLYPEADAQACIDCGLCEKVCNELHPFTRSEPLKVLAAVNRDEAVRMKSSSGGLFHLLAQRTIEEGGVVFGARFDSDWQVLIDYADTMEGVKAFMGSKYVQASIADSYKDARRFLSEGRKVLFSGTPCQIAGLHQFLRREYANLLTVDIVCHGTPSPKVWGLYLEEKRKGGKVIRDVVFRDKSCSWKDYNISFTLDDGTGLRTERTEYWKDLYMKAFVGDVTLRPSCYACKAKDCSSRSDLTLADFWGIRTIFPEMDDDKGTSLLIIHSAKGEEALDYSKFDCKETSYALLRPLNPSCFQSSAEHAKREWFFANLEKKSLSKLLSKSMRPTFVQRLRRLASGVYHRIKKVLS